MADVTPPTQATAQPNPTPAAQTPPPPPPPAEASPSDWMSGFNDEAKGYVQTKGFKGATDLLDSYRNLEKLRGVPEDRLLKLPENMNTPEGRAILEKLGAPKDASGYQLEVPEGQDPANSKWAAEEFAKLGMPKDMAEGFVKAWNQKSAEVQAQAQAEAKAAQETAMANLKTKWGMAFEQNKTMVENAARQLQLSEAQTKAIAQALGPEGAPELLLKLSGAMQESKFHAGGQAGEALSTPQQAMSQIRTLQGDVGFMQKVAAGDSQAKAKWNNLHEMAFPGMVNI